MPSFEVQPCTEADIPRVFEIISLAFANDHEYMDAIFPAHGTPEGRRAGSERMLQIFQGDPYGNFTKVIDKDTGKIAGAAKWNLYKNGEVPPQPAIGGDYWDSEDDKEFAQALFHNFFAMRQKVIQETNGNLVGMSTAGSTSPSVSLTNLALEMMMVDPAYQRMGVGRLLVRWGLAKADELGVEVSYTLFPDSISADIVRLSLKARSEVADYMRQRALMVLTM
jgi:GNAT superfamily N-acetyltransferase